uniref:SWI/SNF-related matrix-associated actin-dependent regulator of chromatin subfamily E member 1-related n=1 Tax=Aceria tosichella TaxID=561515 RepID=A0A6G1SJW7_9ACAR
MDSKKNRLNIDVDALADRKVKRRKKRDLNETVFYEINDKKVPVFTQDFLEQNRIVEGELRKLRKVNNDFEEHNSVLIKYIENLHSACDQVCDELKDLEGLKGSLKLHLDQLKTQAKQDYNLDLGDNGESTGPVNNTRRQMA